MVDDLLCVLFKSIRNGCMNSPEFPPVDRSWRPWNESTQISDAMEAQMQEASKMEPHTEAQITTQITTMMNTSSKVKEALINIDFYGRIAQNTMQLDDIKRNKYAHISGSFATNMYMLINGMHGFKPNDIDVFMTSMESPDESLFTKHLGDYLDTNFPASRSVDCERTKARLYNLKKWKHYDWNSLLHDDKRFRVWSHVKNTWRNTTLFDLDVNLIDFHQLGTSLHASNECTIFSSFVRSTFDMWQCAVSILKMEGTLFPQIVLSPEAHSSIVTKQIKFVPRNSFKSIAVQLKRIRKYQKREFGLVTDASVIVRL